ncbi:MAG: methionine--tRNA ligase [bacterium]|nr:methionine--tRNA ligase [bacterium]
MGKFYLTTAIDYVNAPPHLGHAYEKVCADVINRYRKAMGDNTFFCTGVDEHSLNVYRQAKAKNMSPRQYCDEMVPAFKLAWQSLGIEYDRFIRTTDEDHIASVKKLLQKIYDKGDIYKDKYKGWYCVSCEAYLQESDLIEGKCPIHNRKAEWLEEENYFFRLSGYSEKILDHINKCGNFITPEARKNEIINIIKSGLQDISISRASEGWGIELPFDPAQTVYVWIDALTNYISAAGFSGDKRRFKELWPADLHVIGKDITRFHCIIWPAMLLSAGISLPLRIYAHGFMTLEGRKMSKTENNFIDPKNIAEAAGSDAVRYFIVKEMPYDDDMDFTWDRFWLRYNTHLANDFGNLSSRILSMAEKYCGNRIPGFSERGKEDDEFKNVFCGLTDKYQKLMDDCRLSSALDCAWELVAFANKYVETSQPWKLHKAGQNGKLDNVLRNLLEGLRVISVLLYPFMPVASHKIWKGLGIKPGEKQGIFSEMKPWGILPEGGMIEKTGMIFPRKEKDKL